MLIRIPAAGEDVSIAVPGERQEKLGGVTGSENDECLLQGSTDAPCWSAGSVPAGIDPRPTKKFILFGVRISSCYTRRRSLQWRQTRGHRMYRRFFPRLTFPILLLCAGCPDGGGGDGGFGTPGTTSRVYVVNRGSDDVSGYTMSTSTGALTAIPGSPFSGVTDPTAIVVSPNGSLAYVANQGGSVSAFTINSVTGAPAPAGSPVAVGTNPNAVVIAPHG